MSLQLSPGTRLVAATHNSGKARELSALLSDRFEVVAAGDLGLNEPDEPETTFMGNAVLKARTAADASGLVAIADDSGLCVAGLDGAPGIHSARWAGPGRDFAHAMALVESRLEDIDVDDRAAWFVCALAVAWPHGPIVAVEGRVDGALTFPPRGDRGFGYDPDIRSRRRGARPSARWIPTQRTRSATAPGPSKPSRRRFFERTTLRRPWGSMSIGPIARASAPTATSTWCAIEAGATSRSGLVDAIVDDLGALRRDNRTTATGVDLFRRRHALADGPGRAGADRRGRAFAVAAKRRAGDHLGGQSHRRGGRSFRRPGGGGVNRLSLGVQSLDDDALRFLGRNHDAAAARRAVDRAGAIFPRLSLDLIYALPGQTRPLGRAS